MNRIHTISNDVAKSTAVEVQGRSWISGKEDDNEEACQTMKQLKMQ
jgi:hypothetical protein